MFFRLVFLIICPPFQVNIADFEEASVLGGDTAEYLKKVGADDETIARLKAEGGIRLGDDIVPEEDRAPVAPVE